MNAPGIVHDLPDETYHADPALSASGAKKLLPPSCPALYKWDRDNGQAPRQEFDFGHAAHAKVLGVGAEVVVIDAKDWRSKTAQAERDAVRAEGKTPLLAADVERVDGMASALRQHPVASALLDPDRGRPEVSLFWRDDTHGVDRRARLDWLPDSDGGPLLVADYKTAASSEPGAIAKAVANYGYAMQDQWYRDAVRACGIADDVRFLFLFQMKEPPYLVTVAQLDMDWQRIGRGLNDRALQVFAECSVTDTWPGFTDDIALISPPAWAAYAYQELTA